MLALARLFVARQAELAHGPKLLEKTCDVDGVVGFYVDTAVGVPTSHLVLIKAVWYVPVCSSVVMTYSSCVAKSVSSATVWQRSSVVPYVHNVAHVVAAT